MNFVESIGWAVTVIVAISIWTIPEKNKGWSFFTSHILWMKFDAEWIFFSEVCVGNSWSVDRSDFVGPGADECFFIFVSILEIQLKAFTFLWDVKALQIIYLWLYLYFSSFSSVLQILIKCKTCVKLLICHLDFLCQR